MIEMASVLIGSVVLIVIAYELTFLSKREWGENQKGFFKNVPLDRNH